MVPARSAQRGGGRTGERRGGTGTENSGGRTGDGRQEAGEKGAETGGWARPLRLIRQTQGGQAPGGRAGSGEVDGERPRAQRPAHHAAVPPVAADDLGGAEWERALIRAIRERGLLWRTEAA